MDDYNVNVLSEAKNEYSSRLVTILTPLMLEGVKSIFDEATKLCLDNDEEEKYLMTFQNFLSRVPKWNSTIIEEETKRIVTKSNCSYLEDLLTCVHITQLKILTSIRVSQKQKKIDIDIPKLNTFVHRCYIAYARKLYSNVYLFESNVLPLNYQKNMREAELMCQESVLQVIRENMPVEKILRAYIDETTEEEIVEEEVVEPVPAYIFSKPFGGRQLKRKSCNDDIHKGSRTRGQYICKICDSGCCGEHNVLMCRSCYLKFKK